MVHNTLILLFSDTSRNGKLHYCCHLCGKNLESLYHFRQHLATHGGFRYQVPCSQIESRLKCGNCAYLAVNDHDFKRHMEIHFNTRPYSCPYCGFSAYIPSGIKRHIKSNHPSKPLDVIKDNTSSHLIGENSLDRRVMLVEMDPKVKLNDILSMESEDFENLLKRHGVSVIDLNFILDEKFESVSKTLGLHEEFIEHAGHQSSDSVEDEETEGKGERVGEEEEDRNEEVEERKEEDAKEQANDESAVSNESTEKTATADDDIPEPMETETDTEFDAGDKDDSIAESVELKLSYEDISDEEISQAKTDSPYDDISDNDEI